MSDAPYLDLDTLTRVAGFMRGLEDLSAETGIDVGLFAHVEMSTDNADGTVPVGRLTAAEDQDGVTRYEFRTLPGH